MQRRLQHRADEYVASIQNSLLLPLRMRRPRLRRAGCRRQRMKSAMTEPASKIIDVGRVATTESWLTVYADGRVEYHIENDGYRAEARDEWIDLDHVKSYWPQLIDKVKDALIELSIEEFRSTPECRDNPGET